MCSTSMKPNPLPHQEPVIVPLDRDNFPEFRRGRLQVPWKLMGPGGLGILQTVTLGCLGIGLLILCAEIVGARSYASPEEERKGTMSFLSKNSAVIRGVPPIDAAAPVETETATFAMG
jgi:hypothetical protein